MCAYLVYDADCGLCSLAKSLVKALDLRGQIEPVALQDPRTASLLAGMDEDARWSSFHFVHDGKTASRGEGLVELAGVLPMGSGVPRLAAEVPVLRGLSERVYSFLHGARVARCPA
ncbi:MAG: DUF393 domain-containing protein [Euryarchaeota archaeon]|nr:DUF393 domain-containing protein [Euryarchaeota archaeon]